MIQPLQPGPAECAKPPKSAAPRMGVQGVLDSSDESAEIAEVQDAHHKDAEESLNYPSLNPSPGPCAFRRAGPKSAPVILEIIKIVLGFITKLKVGAQNCEFRMSTRERFHCTSAGRTRFLHFTDLCAFYVWLSIPP